MTANAMLGDRERCLAAGMDDYVAKPISLEVIDRVLSRWLAGGDGSPTRAEPEPAEGEPASDGLDPARLSELRELFPGPEMTSMLRQLVGELSQELDRLQTAAAEGDGATVSAAAHRIKNSAQLVGAQRLADAASRAGDAVRESQAASSSIGAAAVATLRGEWLITRSAIDAELARV
jgi:HPt (histidine-containing phosphotransfer) domain-containing protein